MKKNILNNKKLKHGTLSAVVIVAFIAIVITLNLILTSIASKNNLTIDLTAEELYTVSDQTKAILDTLGEDFAITIYFLQDKDLYESDKYALMVRDLGEEYARIYPDKVKVEYKDIKKDPSFVEKYKSESQTSISSGHVIIQGKYHYRILTLSAFFMISEETGAMYAFNGEQRFTAAMLQSSIFEPQVVSFTAGHGETVSPSMLDIFAGAGFEIKFVDLSQEDIDERTRILIASNPRFDFLGYSGEGSEEKTEIEKVAEYVNKFNNLIVFVDSTTPALPNLQEYLLEYWGLGYKPYHKIYDEINAIQSDKDGYSIVGKYIGTEDTSAAYNIHKGASAEGSGAKTVFRNSVELFLDKNKAKDGVKIEPVIATHNTAITVVGEGEEDNPQKGEKPLMLLSTYYNYGDNNVVKYQYVMLVSSTSFASDTYLQSSYGNRRVVSGMARVMATERISPDIKFKPFIKEALSIEIGTATTLTWLVVGILPGIVIILGIAMFVKRRHL